MTVPHTDFPVQPGNPAALVPPGPALAFSCPCPHCRTLVTLPWCPLVSSVLDRLDALEAAIGALQTLDEEDLP